ncbi:conserved hypothetical protein [Leishmania infantum JPCM5]|uniref:Uncharacterized protein n=2 Tax=Leishmania infantum TaxID=5671 RepID=A4HZU1_LEIIN|nr:conserved hypothetical protein [Leishmania infantum JPCM5]CAC9487843.1 hypothetical_protein_-_conserved [Leishmania infantum]CAM68005.1 conserved hypothetical protein [Leishmania infantum JPCM5]SUZ41758.1 hypothetical_protein_-_conserved [Leishmania infantum]|eukprot:XP_001465582.1 conserved hypothetical protein [Leishmania infantum JPCM5]
MPLVSSTTSQEGGGTDGSAHLIHSICAVDDSTLIFAIASAAGADSAARSPYDAALFSFCKAADSSAKAIPRGPRTSPSGTCCTGAIRDVLYARSLADSRGADFSSSTHEECGGCPTGCSGAEASIGVGNSVAPPTSGLHSRHSCLLLEHSAAAGAVAPLSERPSDSLAALRASQLMYLLHRRDADATAPLANVTAGAPPASSRPSSPHLSGDALAALHVVRQEAWQRSSDASNAPTPLVMAHDAASATMISTDVLCYFDCGCAALATFQLTRGSPPAEWLVQLGGCVWIPFAASSMLVPGCSAGAVKGWASALTWATGAPLVSSLVRPLPPTASLTASADAHCDGSNSLLELLVVWCSPTVASSSSAFSSTDARPVARYASLRCCSGNLPTASAITSAWRLHKQAIFDMSELLRLAPRQSVSNEAVHDSVCSCSVLPHASVRGLHWLPGTADFTQLYPLLAVLYAAPTVHSRCINGLSGAPPEPCLDSLAVCYLKEDGPHLSAATVPAAATPQKAPPMVMGRLLVGPWSVRGLSLAHPQFLFATALAGRRSPPSRPPPATNKQRATVAAASAPSAAQAFRTALHSCADAATAVLGVFQRPAQEPYGTSSLFRGGADAVVCRGRRERTLAGTQFSDRDVVCWREFPHLQRAGSEREGLKALRNSKVFAFVLYGRDGEVARCILDGYVDDAQTTWLDPYIMPANAVGSPRAIGDPRGRGGEVEKCTVARVCALLSEKAPALSAQRVHWHSAVVITIQAQWTRALPVVAERRHDNDVLTNGGIGAGEHWSFSLHLSQRLRSSAGPGGSLQHSWCAAPLAMMGRILCWRSAAASDDVSCLVCGYTTAPHHGDATSDAVDAHPHTLLEGVFELRLSSSLMNGGHVDGCPAAVTQATNAALGVATRGGAATSQPSAALANLRPWAVGICTRVVSPSAFSDVLSKASTADTFSTAFDLLSHTPTFSVAVARLGATVSDSVVPIALAWVAGEVHEAGVDNLARTAPPLSATATSSRSSLLSCVRQLDAVALLRSGDVVGWRCASHSSAAAVRSAGHLSGEGAVLHLGAICHGLGHDAAPPLEQLFLESLLNRGAGADVVHMEVVTAPVEDSSRRVGHRQPSAGLPPMEVDSSSLAGAVTETAAKSTVLLVLAVGSLVGVVDLAAGEVVVVQDLRADLPNLPAREDGTTHSGDAPLATTDGAIRATAAVLRLQRLPVATPCGWMAGGDAAQQGAGAAVGTSWYFVWRGAREGQRDDSLLTFVLRLSFLCWADVVSAHVGAASSSATGGVTPAVSVLDTEPSPLPLVTLQVDACWAEESEPAARSNVVSSASTPATSHYLSLRHAPSSAAAYVGWLPCAMACVDGVGRAAPRGTAAKTGSEASSAEAADYLPFLSVCDAALLRSLWPATATDEIKISVNQNCAPSSPPSGTVVPRCRPPLRFLCWGGVAPRPSLPSSCFLYNQIGATCMMEQLTGGGAAAGFGMPLNIVYRWLLGESRGANTAFTPPERDGDVDLPHRLTCRQVLYVSTLTLNVGAVGERHDEHEAVPHDRTVSGSPTPAAPGSRLACSSLDPTSWHVLLCTLLLHKGEQTSKTNGSTRTLSGVSASFDVGAVAASAPKMDWRQSRAASYLLCGVPACAPVVPPQQQPGSAAAAHRSPLFTWHWIPLYVSTSFPAPDSSGGVQQHNVPLAVTRVVPSPRRSSAATLSSTGAATVIAKNAHHEVTPCSYFYCEGILCSPAAAAAPHGQHACYCLSVEGDRLRHLLERSASAASTEGIEQVYMYTTVNPDLVRVVGA